MTDTDAVSPEFSIIIPVKEINNYVRENINYIKRMSLDLWEVLIIPNSLDEDFDFGPRIFQIASGRVAPGRKRDIGAKHSKGTYLVFLDDDSYPDEDLLENIRRHFANSNIAAVGGPGITPISNTFWQKVSGAVFLSKLSGGHPERYISHGIARFVDDWPSVNLTVRKSEFDEVNGFDTDYWPGEDTFLCKKLIENGQKIKYAPDVIVRHHRRAGFLNHIKQVGAYGLHRGYFAKNMPRNSLKLRYFIPSAFVAFFALSWLSFILGKEFQAVISFGWILYVGILVGALVEIIRHEKLTVGLAAIIFIFCTHLVYGINFLRGYFSSDLRSKLR